jgi:putative endonuclease
MTRSTVNKGKWGEDIAENYLRKKSYKILFRNWKAERGDIDIIAMDGGCLVFTEVKIGFSEKYGPPELRITEAKKRQLYKLASIFIQKSEKNSSNYESYRFDVVIIDGIPQKYTIRHYKNAFYI